MDKKGDLQIIAVKKFFGYSQNVFVLSVVSLLNDFAGETIKKTSSLFLVNVLGTPTAFVGLVEGIAESTSTTVQIFSGSLSDKLGRRKPFVFAAYTMRAVKGLLVFATSWTHVLGIRFADYIGRGVGKAPRDALIAESADGGKKGSAFGFNRALDSMGAVLGLLAVAAVIYFINPSAPILTRQIFNWAVILSLIPVLLSSFLIFAFVKDPRGLKKKTGKVLEFRNLGRSFNLFLLVSFVFTLGNPAEAFLVLRAQNLGLGLLPLFLLLAAFSLATAITSVPTGILSDRRGRKKVLGLGWIAFALIFFGFGLATRPLHAVFLFLVFGLYFSLTEGVGKAFVSDLVPADLKGTAYGLYNTVLGVTLLPASIAAGVLWDKVSPSAPFIFGGFTAVLAVMLLYVFRGQIRPVV